MGVRRHFLVTVVGTNALVALVALTACSNSPRSTPSHATSTPPSAITGSATVGAPPGAQVLGTPRMGAPFTITITYANNAQPTKLQLTVESVTCGKPLDPAVLAHEATGAGSSTPTPTPESGKQYCVVAMQAVNVGTGQAVWDADNTVSLNVGDTQYVQTQADASYALNYEQYWYSQGQVGPTFGINPGSKGPVHGVFQIPVGATPTSLWVSSGTAIQTIDGVQPGYLVQL